MNVNLFNPTDAVISSHIRGVHIVVPARSGTSTTEKKAAEMMKLHSELTMTQRKEFRPEDFTVLQAMKKADLVEYTTRLMRGDFQSAVEFQQEKENEVKINREKFMNESEEG